MIFIVNERKMNLPQISPTTSLGLDGAGERKFESKILNLARALTDVKFVFRLVTSRWGFHSPLPFFS